MLRFQLINIHIYICIYTYDRQCYRTPESTWSCRDGLNPRIDVFHEETVAQPLPQRLVAEQDRHGSTAVLDVVLFISCHPCLFIKRLLSNFSTLNSTYLIRYVVPLVATEGFIANNLGVEPRPAKTIFRVDRLNRARRDYELSQRR